MNCQVLPGISGLQDDHIKKDDHCLGSKVKLPLYQSVQARGELLVTEKGNDGYNCDSGDKGDGEIGENSVEGSYFENRDPVRNNGAKHGFGNAERHVLISLLSPSCLYFSHSHFDISRKLLQVHTGCLCSFCQFVHCNPENNLLVNIGLNQEKHRCKVLLLCFLLVSQSNFRYVSAVVTKP